MHIHHPHKLCEIAITAWWSCKFWHNVEHGRGLLLSDMLLLLKVNAKTLIALLLGCDLRYCACCWSVVTSATARGGSGLLSQPPANTTCLAPASTNHQQGTICRPYHASIRNPFVHFLPSFNDTKQWVWQAKTIDDVQGFCFGSL